MTSRPPAPPPDLPGFRFVELLGTGGFADVFQYEQLGLGRRVAVKVLLSDIDADVHASFEVESSVMAQLSNHPSIVSIYQAGITADGRPFLVMEHCPPPHLALRLRAKPLTVAKALEVTIQLSGAVETAHRLGILHRDIKPANILFTEFGRAALTDFGISVTTAGAQSGEGIGMSVPWAPPEQLTVGAPMGPSGDVYALAATLWTALVGRSPFQVPGGANDAMAMAPRVRTMPVPPTRRPDVPESLERALRTAMAKSPHERYDSALAFARALQAIQAEMHVPVTTIDVLDEQVIDTDVAEDGGGTRVSGFVSIDPEPPRADTRTGMWSFGSGAAPTPTAPPPPPPVTAPPAAFSTPTAASYQFADQTDHLETVHKRAPLPATPTPGDGGAPDRRTRSVPLPALVVIALVVGVIGGAVWLGSRADDATDDNAGRRSAPNPVDPIGSGPPPPESVKVRRIGDGRLLVSWRAPEGEPGDEFEVVVRRLASSGESVVVGEAETTSDLSHEIEGAPGRDNCVSVRTLRDHEYSTATERCLT